MINTYKQVGSAACVLFMNTLKHKLRALGLFEMLEKRTAAEGCHNPQSPEMDHTFKKCVTKEVIPVSQVSRANQ